MSGPSDTRAAHAPRKRVLFVAEAVTLAHVARPLALAASLDRDRFDIDIACAPRYRQFFPAAGAAVHELYSISGEEFAARLEKGRPLYELATLRRYVRDELTLLQRVRPDVVVGDFRLSLAVSARLMRLPYVMLANAYWSPYARPRYEAPSHPLARLVGRRIASPVFRLVRPLAFAWHALPMNRLRREHGLPSIGLDLRRVYTDADRIAYADIPELIPTYGLPAHHSYIGPVLWSAPVAPPPWWDRAGAGRPLVYVTLGSSGDAALLPRVIEALAALPVDVAVATAGARLPGKLAANVFCADFLPGERAARRAALVVCNGGSPTSQQALAEGVPVLGIPRNLDQFLNMTFVARRGAGEWLASDKLTAGRLRVQARRMLENGALREAAGRIGRELRAYDTAARFAALLRAF